MRLLLDLQCVQSSSSARGIGRYALALAEGLVSTAGAHQVEVLLNGGDDADRLLRARTALEHILPARAVHVFEAPWPWRHRASETRRTTAEALYSAAVAALDPDAVLVGSVFEGDGENVLEVRPPGQRPPTAAVLYDLIPALDPATYLLGPGAKGYWRRMEHLRRCDLLLAISEHSARQAQTHLGDQCPRTAAVWGGPYASGVFPDHDARLLEAELAVMPDRFLLSVGGDHPRKNLDRLVAAWAQVPADERRGAAVVVACRLNVGTVRRLRRLAYQSGLAPGELVLTGEVSDAALTELYATALAFVFPSTEEGLGMPPLEAMAAGCPTIMARGSSLSELADAEEAFFDGRDVHDMARALRALLRDEGLRERLRGVAARSSRKFTWTRSAMLVWQELERLVAASAWTPPAPAGPAATRVDDAARVDVEAVLAPLVVANRNVAADLVARGAVEVPLLLGQDDGRASRHDPYAAAARSLSGLDLDEELVEETVRALAAPARWWLERPLPVCLLLSGDPYLPPLEAVASAAGVHLLVVGPGCAHLAQSADAVVVDLVADGLAPVLHRARRQGALVFEVRSVPVGARTISLPAPVPVPVALAGPRDQPDSWVPVLAAVAAAGRTTGWPWTSG